MSGTRPVIVDSQKDLDRLASWMTIESLADAMATPNGPAVLRALFRTPRAPWVEGPDGAMLMGLDDPPTPCLSLTLGEQSDPAVDRQAVPARDLRKPASPFR